MNDSIHTQGKIPFVESTLMSDYQLIGDVLRHNGRSFKVDKLNWPEYSFAPNVQLFAAYSEQYLWLHFEVEGDFFRAEAIADHEAVWEDSCVEFFMSKEVASGKFGKDSASVIYRNFEFNVLGVCLSALGTKEHRDFLTSREMETILRFPSVRPEAMPLPGQLFDWNLSVAIPLDLLALSPGQSFGGNFYKCGDLTKAPHYLSWSPITSPEPDFHLPADFGDLELVHN